MQINWRPSVLRYLEWMFPAQIIKVNWPIYHYHIRPEKNQLNIYVWYLYYYCQRNKFPFQRILSAAGDPSLRSAVLLPYSDKPRLVCLLVVRQHPVAHRYCLLRLHNIPRIFVSFANFDLGRWNEFAEFVILKKIYGWT